MIHLQARKSLGQNFLVDNKALTRIASAIAPASGDTLIEIGPGTGLLTRHLLATPLRKLIAFELDKRAVPELEREFASEGDRFRVIEQDFLEVDLASIAAEAGVEKLRVAGNIPYYITSPILFKLLDERTVVSDATLLMQLEVAERLTAKPSTKEYGIPTVLANFYGEVKFLFKVPAGAFRPAPRVDSAVVHIDLTRDYFTRAGLTPPAGFEPKLFQRIVRTLFGMRRKTIRNNLKNLLPTAETLETLEATETGNRYLSQRAEALSIPDFLELYHAISGLS